MNAPDDATEDYHLVRAHLDTVLPALPDIVASALRMRYGMDDGQPRTLTEVGQAAGVTRERVRQIEMRQAAKLRENGKS